MKISELIIEAAKEYGDYDADGATDDDKYSRVKIADWINYYNDAQRALLRARPDANYKVTEWQLTANKVNQAVPSDCEMLISIDLNMGSDGATPGAPIQPANEKVILNLDPTWYSATGQTEMELYSYDLRKPDHFKIYPRVHASTAVYVRGVYSYLFTDAVSGTITTTDVEAGDLFLEPLKTWMKKKAWDIDTDSARADAMSTKMERSFYNQLGIEFKAAATVSGKGE